jgi:hypothetical protein
MVVPLVMYNDGVEITRQGQEGETDDDAKMLN